MILYHGTTQKRGEEILASEIIKCKTERDFEAAGSFNGTTDGYVYLTTDLSRALYYGNAKTIGNDYDRLVYIFKIDIPEELLMADLDELFVVTRKEYPFDTSAVESIKICQCVRVPQDISIKNSKYTIMPSTKNSCYPEEIYKLRQQLFDLNQVKNRDNIKECQIIDSLLEWKSI